MTQPWFANYDFSFANSTSSLQTTSLRMTTSSSARSALQIAFLASAARPYARASSTEMCMHYERRSFTSATAIASTRRGEAKAQAKKRGIFAPQRKVTQTPTPLPLRCFLRLFFRHPGVRSRTTLWRVEVRSALGVYSGLSGMDEGKMASRCFRCACRQT